MPKIHYLLPSILNPGLTLTHVGGRLDALLAAVPALVASQERSLEAAHHAAVAITTTDLVSKSAALEVPFAPSRVLNWVYCGVLELIESPFMLSLTC